jgi:uncharacterized protein (DUF4213/DUF364 family)
LIDSVISGLPKADMPVETIVQGSHGIMVVSANCGIAEIPVPDITGDPIDLTAHTGRPLADLFGMAKSFDPLEACVGVAAINAALAAALESPGRRSTGMPRAGGKVVGLVGEFAFAPQLKDLARDVIQVEPEEAEHILPGVDIAILPGRAIVDHTLERLLAASSSGYAIVFGPSTFLSPVLFDYGADQLVGVKVENREETTRWIIADRENLMECTGLRSVVLGKP